MTVRALLFDKDGTLFDFHATWSGFTRRMIEAEAGGDPDLAQGLAGALGYDLETGDFAEDSIVVAGTTEEAAARMLPLLPGERQEALVQRMNDRAAQAPQVEAAPLRTLLGALRARGLALGVATNDAEAPARAHLRAAGVVDLFDFIAGADSGHGAKPAAGQLLAFAEAVGMRPQDCAMIGDSLHDMAAARACGMRAVAVLSGPAGHPVLAPAADVVLPDIAALPDWLSDGAPFS
ncbi:HAD family hydrolase [Pseudoroseicyclus aestuarii]|uniref:phosphoglycolate phosphatase n=1 Tax=Pseudoroseicyclus aestuarii TaxID=1795041 RepID=A0A318SMJ2_9RHOB|nr:HAD family hydrolase [Pseudoroseicyclus aestuarii]PYE81260.1 phosphoglycolate phosphatase [Pseudoroseicyclus aestuarii]